MGSCLGVMKALLPFLRLTQSSFVLYFRLFATITFEVVHFVSAVVADNNATSLGTESGSDNAKE